ncbi:MAG TPA: hypothetical protein PLM75_03040 [bacterium]|nr:hypothetical protein [bacterium]
MKNKIILLFFGAICCCLFLIQCSTINSDLKDTIQIGGVKEVKIPTNIQTDSGYLGKKIQFIFDKEIKLEKDISKIEQVLANANAAIIKEDNGKLWFYFEETRKFYDSGWYWYDSVNNAFVKAIRTYFDVDLINDLKPKYNKKEYYYFKKKSFDKIELFRFDQPLYTWLYTTFKNEISDTNILIIALDEYDIWFALKNNIKKFNMKNEIWYDVIKERNLYEYFASSDVSEINVSEYYIWFALLDGSLIGYDKKNDVWRFWRQTDEFTRTYISYIFENENNAFFKTNVGIKKFDKQRLRWSDFDEANHLSDKNIKNVELDKNENLWVETANEIARYSVKSNVWDIIKKSNFPERTRAGENYIENINNITFDFDNMWLAAVNGVLIYSIESKKWIIYDKKDINDYFRTDITNFNLIFIDDNYVWLGSNDGLFRIKK